MLHSMRSRNVAAPLPNGHHQFHFVMQIGRKRGIRQLRRPIGRTGQHCVGRFEEEERRFAIRTAHFTRMLGVITPNAIDAVHGKLRRAARDRHHRHRRGGKSHIDRCIDPS